MSLSLSLQLIQGSGGGTLGPAAGWSRQPGWAMAAEQQPDSLEGWVAVRENAFAEPEPHKLRFLVGWNEIESKFAVTCHNRTLQEEQQQRGAAGPAAGGGSEATQQQSWAGLFSAQALLGVHRQLAALNERLEPCFPQMPAVLAGRSSGSLWALLFPSGPGLEEAELEALCHGLERYLGWALELCGRRVVLDSLFAQDQQQEAEYFENLHEFRRKALKGHMVGAKEALRRVLHKHKDADTMVALMKVYEEEDDTYQELVTMATQFYQYLLQPFRDMRELATLYRLEILKSLQMDKLGPKRIEALQREAEDWTKQAEEAVCSIQDITVSYFKETAKALAAMHKQMEQDQKRFGHTAWASASPRLENLKYMLAKETLQHMRAQELCLNHKRAAIRKNMENLDEQEENAALVEKLELEYYETQLELYDVQFEILKHEEMLLITQLETLRRQIKEKQDEVVYYDTCENPEEFHLIEQTLGQHCSCPSEVKNLSLKTQRLEAKRGTICARRAYLRNKKDQCEESRRLRLQEAQESIKHFHQHHSIQLKRDKKKDEEKKKKAWISQERQKTLERLKTFKEKCPAEFVLKTSRSQPHSPKQVQDISRQTPALSSQPASIISPSPKQRKSTRPAQARSLKAARGNIPADISVQIFVPAGDPKHQKHSEGLLPPPPPPPPPPLPLPVCQPLPLKIPVTTKDQLLPLNSEGSTENAATQRREDSSKRSVNNYSGSMDEVLASLKRGEVLLRKVEQPSMSPPNTSVNDSILSAIRQGVKLRKVNQDPKKDISKGSDSELERSIKAAIQRINKVSADSEEDENGDHNNGEWDS
ncbi:WASP homolog-associated protein with actin, membranes and microtubules [Carettochelys insculpta]|uniref:WASP homolog-associated protein with actin, membranes and microtubules n=1 Tax=Carettochelys insculpta TaxID=44489 RepID=UPI003EB7774E